MHTVLLDRRHPEGVDYDVTLQIVSHRPAEDALRAGVHHRREEEPPLPGRYVGDVGEPHLVRRISGDVTADEVCNRSSFGNGRLAAPARALTTRHTRDPEFAHQTCDALAGDADPFVCKVVVQTRDTVGPTRRRMVEGDAPLQVLVFDRAR